jgi:hypothetical protein
MGLLALIGFNYWIIVTDATITNWNLPTLPTLSTFILFNCLNYLIPSYYWPLALESRRSFTNEIQKYYHSIMAPFVFWNQLNESCLLTWIKLLSYSVASASGYTCIRIDSLLSTTAPDTRQRYVISTITFIIITAPLTFRLLFRSTEKLIWSEGFIFTWQHSWLNDGEALGINFRSELNGLP